MKQFKIINYNRNNENKPEYNLLWEIFKVLIFSLLLTILMVLVIFFIIQGIKLSINWVGQLKEFFTKGGMLYMITSIIGYMLSIGLNLIFAGIFSIIYIQYMGYIWEEFSWRIGL